SAGPDVISENDATVVAGSFIDAGTLDTHVVVITWGDSSANTTLNLAANVLTFSASHQYLDNRSGNAAYTDSATITDKDGASGSGTTSVAVNNVAPAQLAVNLSTTFIHENDTVALSGSFADPGTLDTHTIVVDWGDGSVPTAVEFAASILAFGPLP